MDGVGARLERHLFKAIDEFFALEVGNDPMIRTKEDGNTISFRVSTEPLIVEITAEVVYERQPR